MSLRSGLNVLSIDQLNQLAADLVLDANVALKWYLQDEQYQSQANLVRRHWADGQLELIAPDIIVYEISVGLNEAVRNPRRSIRARDVPWRDKQLHGPRPCYGQFGLAGGTSHANRQQQQWPYP
jgi:hypothetical protein